MAKVNTKAVGSAFGYIIKAIPKPLAVLAIPAALMSMEISDIIMSGEKKVPDKKGKWKKKDDVITIVRDDGDPDDDDDCDCGDNCTCGNH